MERYNLSQSINEADAMTTKLEKEHPDQAGVFTSEQYENAHALETDEIYKTAIGTVEDLAKFTEINLAKEVWKLLKGVEENENLSKITTGKPHLVELRYKMSNLIIKELAKSENIKQAVELASGFTPHAQELLGSGILSKYIESDLPINTKKKMEINSAINQDLLISYAPGNVYDPNVWRDIDSRLEDGSVVIFSEGFMLYTTKAEREILANEVKSILKKHDGYFMFEDSTRFHPEFVDNPSFKPFFDKISKGSSRDLGAISQEEMTNEWEDRGFKIERILENIPLDSESKLPELSEEIELIKKNYKMWKLSLA